MADTIEELQSAAIRFRDARDWGQFHRPKDLALGLSIEAAELSELFLWKSEAEIEAFLGQAQGRERLAEEMGDVFIFLLYLAAEARVDLGEAVLSKIEKNAAKYPVEKARGNAKKYSDL